jgi:hypothetical protein
MLPLQAPREEQIGHILQRRQLRPAQSGGPSHVQKPNKPKRPGSTCALVGEPHCKEDRQTPVMIMIFVN